MRRNGSRGNVGRRPRASEDLIHVCSDQVLSMTRPSECAHVLFYHWAMPRACPRTLSEASLENQHRLCAGSLNQREAGILDLIR
jgi:hypothetical protein